MDVSMEEFVVESVNTLEEMEEYMERYSDDRFHLASEYLQQLREELENLR